MPCRDGFEEVLVINETLKELEKELIALIADTPNIKRSALMNILGCSKLTLERMLKKLSSEPLNFIEYKGSKKMGRYFLTDKGKSL